MASIYTSLSLSLSQNPSTVEEIKTLCDEGAEKQLHALLDPDERMVFGTAGLRAKMGGGYSRMNDLTVIQTAQVQSRGLPAVFELASGSL